MLKKSWDRVFKVCALFAALFLAAATLPAAVAEAYFAGEGRLPALGQIGREIEYFTRFYGALRPAVYLCYDRTACYAKDDHDLRVTFDRKLSSSPEVGKFLTGDYLRRPVFPAGESLLEVKWDEVMPRHLKEILRTDSLQWTAFSKYYMCRMLHL